MSSQPNEDDAIGCDCDAPSSEYAVERGDGELVLVVECSRCGSRDPLTDDALWGAEESG